MQEHPANSKKSDNPKPQEKAIKGEVIIPKPSLTMRFKNLFLGGDLNQAAQYVLADVIVPAIRNLVAESIQRGVDRVVYGDNSYNRRPSRSIEPNRYSPRVQYSRISDRTGPPRGYVPGQAPRGNDIFREAIVGTREDVDTVVERVGDIMDGWEVVSVADVLGALGQESQHIDNKWGWDELPTINVQQVREGWKLTFPPPKEI